MQKVTVNFWKKHGGWDSALGCKVDLHLGSIKFFDFGNMNVIAKAFRIAEARFQKSDKIWVDVCSY